MKLAHSLNRPVLVSVPAFFGDEKTRTCTLVDVEAAGLWLATDALTERLEPDRSASWSGPVTGFFPFSQILYVVDLSQFAAPAGKPRTPTPPDPAAPPSPKDAGREHPHRAGRPRQKHSRR